MLHQQNITNAYIIIIIITPFPVTNLRQNRHAYIIIRIIINTRYSEREGLQNSQSTKRNKLHIIHTLIT